MFAEVRTFNDPQQHAGSILGWQQVYDQLGRGCLSSELRQVCAERFQIFQEVLDKRVVQRGSAPKGRLCIAMSLGGAPVVQGHQVGAHSVVLLRDGEDFVLHAPEGMHFFAANVDTVRFAKLAAYELSSEQLKRLKSVSQVSVDEAVLRRVQQRIHPLFRHLLEQADAVNPAAEKSSKTSCSTPFSTCSVTLRTRCVAGVAILPSVPIWSSVARSWSSPAQRCP